MHNDLYICNPFIRPFSSSFVTCSFNDEIEIMAYLVTRARLTTQDNRYTHALHAVSLKEREGYWGYYVWGGRDNVRSGVIMGISFFLLVMVIFFFVDHPILSHTLCVILQDRGAQHQLFSVTIRSSLHTHICIDYYRSSIIFPR